MALLFADSGWTRGAACWLYVLVGLPPGRLKGVRVTFGLPPLFRPWASHRSCLGLVFSSRPVGGFLVDLLLPFGPSVSFLPLLGLVGGFFFSRPWGAL